MTPTMYTTTAGYDRSAIMQFAWKQYRTVQYEFQREAIATFNPTRFANCLRFAWIKARQQKAEAIEAPAERAARLDRDAYAMDCADRNGSAYGTVYAMRSEAAQLRAA